MSSERLLPWQQAVGWLTDYVPPSERADTSLLTEARKIAYYIGLLDTAASKKANDTIPSLAFYKAEGGRGLISCQIDHCGYWLGGVYGFKQWLFPAGIVHYMTAHHWKPPTQFLADLARLPDPADDVTIPQWLENYLAG